MTSLRLQPSAKTQRILSDEEFEAKLLARVRHRRSLGPSTSWPPEDDEKPVLIRSAKVSTAASPRARAPLTVHDVDLVESDEAAPPVAVHVKRSTTKAMAVKRPRKEDEAKHSVS